MIQWVSSCNAISIRIFDPVPLASGFDVPLPSARGVHSKGGATYAAKAQTNMAVWGGEGPDFLSQREESKHSCKTICRTLSEHNPTVPPKFYTISHLNEMRNLPREHKSQTMPRYSSVTKDPAIIFSHGIINYIAQEPFARETEKRGRNKFSGEITSPQQ
ncbi:hypothetical protein JTE90_025915 [Oedothorax gibbosus]|uniref:Uncharacterized protein n=1 Tax=Oedothorax gibbosus TaxID=931172 RepID=A0AAV6UTA3_9ARAC|nr:hypothetical protein JTE90_025915 [Oedothorax gibbosus]